MITGFESLLIFYFYFQELTLETQRISKFINLNLFVSECILKGLDYVSCATDTVTSVCAHKAKIVSSNIFQPYIQFVFPK